MAAGNEKDTKEVLSRAGFAYGVSRDDSKKAYPFELDENRNIPVAIYDGDAPVTPPSLCDDLDGQSPTSVDVGDVSTEILAANPNRKAAFICNDSDTTIYITLGEASQVSKGIRLNQDGGSITLSKWGAIFTTEQITGIHASTGNTKTVTVQELQ